MNINLWCKNETLENNFETLWKNGVQCFGFDLLLNHVQIEFKVFFFWCEELTMIYELPWKDWCKWFFSRLYFVWKVLKKIGDNCHNWIYKRHLTYFEILRTSLVLRESLYVFPTPSSSTTKASRPKAAIPNLRNLFAPCTS